MTLVSSGNPSQPALQTKAKFEVVMDERIERLILRLMSRGMRLQMMPTFIRDVARVVLGSSYVTHSLVNRRLVERGWPEDGLDECSLQLIVELLEASEVLRVQRVVLQ